MIACYSAEIWCDGIECYEYGSGLARDLRTHERNLLEVGWTKDGDAYFCPRCSEKRTKEGATQTVGISGASSAMQAGGMPRRDQHLPDAPSRSRLLAAGEKNISR